MKNIIACTALLAFAMAGVARAETVNWPQFRGVHSDGLAEGATLPETWSETENVVWNAELPGWGWSSPVARQGKSSWSTRYVWEHEQRTELVTIGTNQVRPYDLDGKVWK